EIDVAPPVDIPKLRVPRPRGEYAVQVLDATRHRRFPEFRQCFVVAHVRSMRAVRSLARAEFRAAGPGGGVVPGKGARPAGGRPRLTHSTGADGRGRSVPARRSGRSAAYGIIPGFREGGASCAKRSSFTSTGSGSTRSPRSRSR